MRGKLRNILGVILILVGLSLIGVTAWMKYDTNREQTEMLESFKNITFESETATNDANKEKSYHITNGKGFAVLDIPKLDLEIGIVQGVEINDIKYNVGHFPDSAMPGEKGNFAIAGHRVSYFGEPFKEIEKLKKGDKVYVTYNGHKYTYEVEEMYEVTPDQTESLKQTEDATITIVTCTIGAKKRIIVKGKLVE